MENTTDSYIYTESSGNVTNSITTNYSISLENSTDSIITNTSKSSEREAEEGRPFMFRDIYYKTSEDEFTGLHPIPGYDDSYKTIEDEFTGLHPIPGYDDSSDLPNLAPAGFVIIVTLVVLANIGICAAVKLDVRLRRENYYFLVSLSVLHLLMAVSLMTPLTIGVISGA